MAPSETDVAPTGRAARSRNYARSCVALLALVVLILACRGSDLPPHATRFSPPDVYRTWWQMVETCSGLHGAFDDVRWYRASIVELQEREGNGTLAYWEERGNRIVLSDNVVEFGRGVRHEMLHAPVRQHGHPRELFAGRCADVVQCEEQCAVYSTTARAPTSASPPMMVATAARES